MSHSQSVRRVEVKGVVLSDTNDVEAVTLFNTSSNKGTITNNNGAFVIEVALNDTIEISALQFQTVSVIIDEAVIKTKVLKILLIEQVNQLDAVTISSGLTGSMAADIANVKTVKSITINFGNMNMAYEYYDDKAFDNTATGNHLKSIIDPEARDYLPDAFKILELLFKSKKKGVTKGRISENKVFEKPKEVLDVYNHKFISKNLNIPLDKVDLFIAFVENQGVDPAFLEQENEFQLLEFLVKQSKLFLNGPDAKN